MENYTENKQLFNHEKFDKKGINWEFLTRISLLIRLMNRLIFNESLSWGFHEKFFLFTLILFNFFSLQFSQLDGKLSINLGSCKQKLNKKAILWFFVAFPMNNLIGVLEINWIAFFWDMRDFMDSLLNRAFLHRKLWI